MTARPWTWWTRRCSRGWRACGRLRHPEYFTTWLTRILLNECSREKKRQDREQAVDQLPEQAWEDPGPPASEGGGPGTAGAAESSDPSALFLRLYFAETAELLRMPRSTVHTREKKALKLLKLELSEEV